MSQYTKVVIEVDARGRMNISALDEEGAGHGYRLAGPKFAGDSARTVATATLTDKDADEIRYYLRISDEIRLSDLPSELHDLTAALDRYRTALALPAQYRDFPHQVQRRDRARTVLCEALASALASVHPSETPRRTGRDDAEVAREVDDLIDMWSSSPDSYAAITSRYPGLAHAIESLRTAWLRGTDAPGVAPSETDGEEHR